ncbi:MAG: hypothetical protein J6P13_06865 [Kiritimatiellae bacterium]|nr:hypothetical protein [Kiritimatiellia bacterium]
MSEQDIKPAIDASRAVELEGNQAQTPPIPKGGCRKMKVVSLRYSSTN